MGFEDFKNGKIEVFEEHNRKYDLGAFKGSEANRYNIEVLKKWFAIMNEYTFVDEADYPGDWEEIDIVDGFATKYGTSHIYVDRKQKIWRLRRTAGEFYGNHRKPFVF